MLQYYYMTYLVAIILGFIQGATEFIPVSSTGHLILVREFLGQNNTSGLAFDAILQLATSFAVLVYFWKDIVKIWKDRNFKLVLTIVYATIPAVILGLLLEDKMETIFRNTSLVAVTLILGSMLMYYAQKVYMGTEILSIKKGIGVGFFQSLALLPGMSRSGSTISGGMILGLSKVDAVRFSFLLSLPILFGTGFKKLFDVRESLGSEFGLSLLLGSLVAFVTGYFAISFLIKYLKDNNFNIFIWYRVVLAFVILLFF